MANLIHVRYADNPQPRDHAQRARGSFATNIGINTTRVASFALLRRNLLTMSAAVSAVEGQVLPNPFHKIQQLKDHALNNRQDLVTHRKPKEGNPGGSRSPADLLGSLLEEADNPGGEDPAIRVLAEVQSAI